MELANLPTVTTGNGVPTSQVSGEYYLDTTTNEMWDNINGVWVKRVNTNPNNLFSMVFGTK